MTNDALKEAFPEVDPHFNPFGSRVLVQLKRVAKKTESGLILVEETHSETQWNVQVAKVIKVGALAFKNRTTGEAWPEGTWTKPGEFVRVPRWGGDRFEIPISKDEVVKFSVFQDHELSGAYEGNPLEIGEFILGRQ